jgi:hypothetical protein
MGIPRLTPDQIAQVSGLVAIHVHSGRDVFLDQATGVSATISDLA